MSELESLIARVQRLEDEQAILHLLYKYCHSLDAGHPDDWLSCFDENVEYEVRYPVPPEPARVAAGRLEGNSVHHRGLTELRAFVTSVISRGGPTRKHVISEPRIDIDGDTGRGTTYYFTLDMSGGAPEVLTFGRYLDRYRRIGDRWLIATRVVATDGQRPRSK